VRYPRLLLGVQIACALALWGLSLVLVSRLPWRLDLTPTKDFTLSARTRELLERLDVDVDVTYFYSSQDAVIRRNIEALLALYADASPHLQVRTLDLDRNPGAAERAGVTSYNIVVLASGDTRLRLDLVNEEILTAGLLRIAGTPPVVAYVVQGHGERPLSPDERRGLSQAAAAMASDRIEARPLSGVAVVPPDADLVLLPGPSRDLAAAEVAALDAWVRGGGRAVLLAEAPVPVSLTTLLAGYGIEPGNDVVVDRQSRLLGADGLSARVAYLNQALIPNPPEVNALLPLAQTIRLEDAPGITADYLALTDETAWADVDRGVLGDPDGEQIPDDRSGPLPIAAIATVNQTDGRLVVVGDADFVTNLHFDVLGNRELFLAMLGLVVRDEPALAERPTSRPPSPLSAFVLTSAESRAILWAAAIIPALVLGLVALLRSRQRS
jgi:gliding motility-associatede transport system auxiliary component